MEITIGQLAVPVILMIILGIIYNLVPSIADRWKAPIAIVVGIALCIVAMFYNEEAFTIQMWIEYILGGLVYGAAAVGLYEGVYRPFKSPRT